MNTYTVIFTQCYEYEVDAHNEDDAFDKAYGKFETEMSRPIARTGYDDAKVISDYLVKSDIELSS